ncbi:MAG: hypothetical protein QQN41_11330 [Nitrosopumilus sp.]
MSKRKIIKLKFGNGKKYGEKGYNPIIKFDPIHKRYGRAEFDICPIFKYGKLKKIFVFRRQQETDECYEIEAQDQKEFQINTWTHKGFDNPNIWMNFWCKDHKTICFRVYVPPRTNIIEFDSLSTFEIRFDREGKDE